MDNTVKIIERDCNRRLTVVLAFLQDKEQPFVGMMSIEGNFLFRNEIDVLEEVQFSWQGDGARSLLTV